MIFLPEERKALADWILGLNQTDFDDFLLRADGPRLPLFSAFENSMPTVAIHFITWLGSNTGQIPSLLRAMVAETPVHDSNAWLESAAARIGQLHPATPAWARSLVDGVPVVNRIPLRQHLQALVGSGAYGPNVMLINGPAGTGRSHSWFLIHHVARSIGNVVPVKIDLKAQTIEHLSIQHIFDLLARVLGIGGDVRKPTVEGATPETIAERHANEIATGLTIRPLAQPVWIVFDSFDRPIPTEIRRFVTELVHLKLDQRLDGCKFFLLGAARDFDVDDPMFLTKSESLGIFSANEITFTARELNTAGKFPLAGPALATRINDLHKLLTLPSGREVCTAISRKLIELRLEVHA